MSLFPPSLEISPDEGFSKNDLFARKEFGEKLIRLLDLFPAGGVLLLD